ncbi:MAG: hypothetical protein WC551_06620 [Patescibacteria group bacterium]
MEKFAWVALIWGFLLTTEPKNAILCLAQPSNVIWLNTVPVVGQLKIWRKIALILGSVQPKLHNVISDIRESVAGLLVGIGSGYI